MYRLGKFVEFHYRLGKDIPVADKLDNLFIFNILFYLI